MSVLMRRMLSEYPEKYCFSRVSCAGSGESLTVIDSHVQFPRHKIVGYCNGLVCLEFERDIMILNSSNETYQLVPYPTHDIISSVLGCPFEHCNKPCAHHASCIHHTSIFVCGFGQDLKTNEFKVVAQVITYFDAGGTYDGLYKQAYVYTLGKNDIGWTQFRFPQDTCFAGVVGYGAWVKGGLYWMCYEPTNVNGNIIPIWSIIKLDLGTLEFSSIEISKEVKSFMRPSFVVMELEDSLGLIVYGEDNPKTVQTWCFEEDSCVWVEKYTSSDSFYDVKCEKVLGYLNDILVLEGLDGSHVLMFDSALNKFWKSYLIRDLPGCMRLFPFFESSVELEFHA